MHHSDETKSTILSSSNVCLFVYPTYNEKWSIKTFIDNQVEGYFDCSNKYHISEDLMQRHLDFVNNIDYNI